MLKGWHISYSQVVNASQIEPQISCNFQPDFFKHVDKVILKSTLKHKGLKCPKQFFKRIKQEWNVNPIWKIPTQLHYAHLCGSGRERNRIKQQDRPEPLEKSSSLDGPP